MRTRRLLLGFVAVVVIVVIGVGAWTMFDAWNAGLLPWQPEPTRVAVTPFADLPTPPATP